MKRGDTVIIIKGEDAGKTGIVERFYPHTNRLIVSGVNTIKRHVKKSAKHPAGGIINANGTIHSSNAMLVCPHCKKPTKIAHKRIDGTLYRICKNCDQTIDKRAKS